MFIQSSASVSGAVTLQQGSSHPQNREKEGNLQNHNSFWGNEAAELRKWSGGLNSKEIKPRLYGKTACKLYFTFGKA